MSEGVLGGSEDGTTIGGREWEREGRGEEGDGAERRGEGGVRRVQSWAGLGRASLGGRPY